MRSSGRGAAEAFLRRSVAIREQGEGPAHSHFAASLEHHAKLLRKMRRPAEAAELEARARAVRARHARDSGTK